MLFDDLAQPIDQLSLILLGSVTRLRQAIEVVLTQNTLRVLVLLVHPQEVVGVVLAHFISVVLFGDRAELGLELSDGGQFARSVLLQERLTLVNDHFFLQIDICFKVAEDWVEKVSVRLLSLSVKTHGIDDTIAV